MKQEKKNENENVLYVMAENAIACFEIYFIKKINQLSALEYVPGGPEYFVGMQNYGGKIIPIFDLAMLLGFRRINPYKLDYQIILFTQDEVNIGLIVDKIIKQGVLNVSKIKFGKDLKNKNYIYDGIVEEEGSPVFVVNISRVIQDKLNLNINIPTSYDIDEMAGIYGK
jgi:chemotaxis signal transduction protein